MGTVTQYNLANVQSALGGSNPISMSEYYRGGPYVPTSRTVYNYEPSSGYYYYRGQSGLYYFWFCQYGGYSANPVTGPYIQVAWDPDIVRYQSFNSYVSSVTVGGYTYERGPVQETVYDSTYGVTYSYYSVRRYTVSTQSINTGVPSSGTISISQLYGAQNP